MKIITIIFLSLILLHSGCATPYGAHHRQHEMEGALVGAVIGGLVGDKISGGRDNERVMGAIIGAGIGSQMGRGYDNTRHRVGAVEHAVSSHTIMVQNSNGSHTPVTITSIGNGQYRGPRGEIYNGLPSESQLRSVYGF